jgi:hypothetical protein
MIVDELPATGDEHILYLVRQSEPGEEPTYVEYLWIDDEWVNLGSTAINFDDYYTKEEANETFVVQEAEESGVTSRLTNGGGSIVGEVATDNYATTIETYQEHTRIEADDLTDDSWGSVVVDADGGVSISAGDNENTNTIDTTLDGINIYSDGDSGEASISISGDEGTIVLEAPNGVQVPEPVNDNDAATKSYVDSLGDNIQTDINNLENEIDDRIRKNKFFDGVSEDWDQFTTEEKVYRLVSAVEDYVTLDISETYSINAAVGLDPQDEIVSDMYEDEIIDLTNEIIGGNE